MHLEQLRCRQFRCLGDIDLPLASGLNVLRGGNAQGKTSILEAILYAATSKSHRTTQDAELVMHQHPDFHIFLKAQRHDREVDLEAHWHKGAKRFKINGVAQPRVSDILGRIQVVFFSPEDIALIKGSASQRRRFLDMEISQINPAYLQALQQYRQALRQRNELLKAPRPDATLMAVWDVQLAAYGANLIAARTDYVDALSNHAEAAHAAIAGLEKLTLQYRPNIAQDADYAAVLQRNLDQDIRHRSTRHGPHRDDIEILIDGHPARHFGSQGQQRTAALALKLAELEVMRAQLAEYPILMLDEVLSELDDERAERLFGAIDDAVQCIVTTTESEPRSGRYAAHARNFIVQGGQVEEA